MPLIPRQQQYICEKCLLIFDNPSNLKNHSQKFCSNPKYSDIQALQQQFNKKSKGKDISLYGKMSLAHGQLKNYDFNKNQLKLDKNIQNNSILIDQQYQSLLKQLTSKQDLKKKIQRDKNQAYQQLQYLQKKQNNLLINAKQEQLLQVLKRKQQLSNEQQKISQEMKQYQAKRQLMQKQLEVTDKEDYIYQQAKNAGRLAKQREMLQSNKRDIQYKLRQKKQEKAQLQSKLNSSKISIKNQVPNLIRNKNQTYQNNPMKSSNSAMIKLGQDSLENLAGQNQLQLSSKFKRKNNPIVDGINNNNYPSYETSNYNNFDNKSQSHQQANKSNNQFNLMNQKQSEPLKIQPDNPYLSAKTFSKNEKLLTDMLNRNGKSDQDLFIQQLNAQQFDSLNLLSKIPKTSQLYEIKLKQYQQLSKLRDQYKKQAHKKRIQKMKRQFQYQKLISDKQMKNALWVDQNRMMMMAQQIKIVKNQQQYQKQQDYKNKKSSFKPQQNQPDINDKGFNRQPKSYQYLNQNRHNNGENTNPYNIQSNSIQNVSNQSWRANTSSKRISQINGTAHSINPNYVNKIPSYNENTLPKYNQMRTGQNKNISNRSIPNKKGNNYQTMANQSVLWGYKISIQILKNYTRSRPIKIKLIVKQQDITAGQNTNNSNLLQYQFNTTYHYQRIRVQQRSNPNMSNKLDSQRNILYNQDFIIPKNLQRIYNQNNNQLYLFLFAEQKDQSKITHEPQIYAWYNVKLTHFGQLKQGKFTFNLYGDPSTYPKPSDMNRKKNKLKEQIVIQLSQVVVQKGKPPTEQIIAQQQPYQAPQIVKINSRASNIPSKASNSKESMSNKNVNSVTSINQQLNANRTKSQKSSLRGNSANTQSNGMKTISQMKSNPKLNSKTSFLSKGEDPNFIPNDFQAEFVNINSKNAKNIDISLCQLRTLPSYVGPVKIELSFIDQGNKEVLPKIQILSELGNDMYNPFMNYVHQIRNQRLLTPTTILFVRILALNVIEYQIYQLGFTVYYMFFDNNTEPCQKNNINDYYISTGYFQLPIFWGNCTPHYTKIDEVIQQYPLIPCASFLLGCNINESEQSLPIPRYKDKVFNTLLFNVEENQARLFEEQYKRQKLESSKIMLSYLQYKGINSKYTTEQYKNYLFNSMSFSSVYESFPVEYMAEYKVFFGLHFQIDKLIVPKDKVNYYYFITVCVCPPGKYYQNKDASDLKIIHSLQVQTSTMNELIFQESELNLSVKLDFNTCLLVEFSRIKIEKSNEVSNDIQTIAHVIVPMFKQVDGVKCVNVIKDTVNTYKGPFQPNNLTNLTTDLAGYLDNLMENVQASEIELSFRLLNGFFRQQHKSNPTIKPSKKQAYINWYSRVIDYEQVKANVRNVISKKYKVRL